VLIQVSVTALNENALPISGKAKVMEEPMNGTRNEAIHNTNRILLACVKEDCAIFFNEKD